MTFLEAVSIALWPHTVIAVVSYTAARRFLAWRDRRRYVPPFTDDELRRVVDRWRAEEDAR